jgi:hypothetical protein
MVKVIKQHRKWIMLSLFIIGMCIIVVNNKPIATNNSPDIDIYTDTEFIKYKFPDIDGIKSVKYYYIDKSESGRGVGPTPIEFSGLITVEDKFVDQIANKYKWEKVGVKQNQVLSDDSTYHFMHSELFDEDYANSLIGYFYLDEEKNVLYFKGDY